MNFWRVFALTMVLASGMTFADATAETVQGVELRSSETMNADTLNQRIQKMAQKMEPIPLILALIGGVEETPRVRVDMDGDADSDFDRAVVTIVRDGFQDDSVRGDWHEFKLARGTDGGWKVTAARRANRCWRSTFKGYRAQNCP